MRTREAKVTGFVKAPGLRALQRSLGAQVGGRATPGIEGHWIQSGGVGSKEERLSIYRVAFFERLYESLCTDFPATRLAVELRSGGPEEFRALVAAYLKAHPPSGVGISDAGAGLAGFIARKSRRGWLAELACLEWAVLESFYSEESGVVDPAALSELGESQWARARFGLAPSLRLLETRFPVERLWRLRREPKVFRKALRGLRAFRGAQGICLWRDPRHAAFAGGVSVAKLDARAFALLGALKRGCTLATACRFLERKGLGKTPSPTQIQRWFGAWIAGGAIIGVSASSR